MVPAKNLLKGLLVTAVAATLLLPGVGAIGADLHGLAGVDSETTGYVDGRGVVDAAEDNLQEVEGEGRAAAEGAAAAGLAAKYDAQAKVDEAYARVKSEEAQAEGHVLAKIAGAFGEAGAAFEGLLSTIGESSASATATFIGRFSGGF